MPLIRIIVESAMIYVLNVLILIILYALDSNGQFVAQEAIVPVCGKFHHRFVHYYKYSYCGLCLKVSFSH